MSELYQDTVRHYNILPSTKERFKDIEEGDFIKIRNIDDLIQENGGEFDGRLLTAEMIELLKVEELNVESLFSKLEFCIEDWDCDGDIYILKWYWSLDLFEPYESLVVEML